MQSIAYGVVIFDSDERAISFYDGREFQADPEKIGFFSPGQIDAARIIQGGQQRFYPQNEVRVVKFKLEANFDLIQTEPPVPIGSIQTAV